MSEIQYPCILLIYDFLIDKILTLLFDDHKESIMQNTLKFILYDVCIILSACKHMEILEDYDEMYCY